MDRQTFDVAPKRGKINIFKTGNLWCFKHFFNDRELFSALSEYYNRDKYRFELKNFEERGRDRIFIMKDLASVEAAMEEGAVKCFYSSDISKKRAS